MALYICAMNYKDLRIVFMGTPDFAVGSLHALIEAGCNIVGVITAPDKPAGRGLQITESAVKKYAVSKGLHILQPDKLKNPEFISALKALKADVQVVVAFRMLPEIVWNMPTLGTINVHASLLPQYRGAAPINWAIINGEKETGVTTFKLQHEIDTGNILLQQKVEIAPDMNAGELHDVLKETGAKLIVKTIQGLSEKNIDEQDQSTVIDDLSVELRHAPKIFTETCLINFNKQIQEVYNLIRGLAPYPAAYTIINNKKYKIFAAQMNVQTPEHAPGFVYSDNKSFLKIACIDGYINITELQPEGKKRMLVTDFLRGNKLM